MTTKNTGGSAQHKTLRDHFAGQAMESLIASTKGTVPLTEVDLYISYVAKFSYKIADAMLQERDK